MLLLPEYMRRLGSTGRFHVGFAEGAQELGQEAGKRSSEMRGWYF
jgi:hypothetical protein